MENALVEKIGHWFSWEDIELLKAQIEAVDQHVLNLRKQIENQVGTKNLPKEILAEIMTIESMKPNQLQQLLVKIL